MVKVFLDDERNPEDVKWINLPEGEWLIVRDYLDFVTKVSGLYESPEFISFDHDLGFGHGIPDNRAKTGLDCAQWLVFFLLERKWPLPPFAVHSMNPVGKANIENFLSNFKNILV